MIKLDIKRPFTKKIWGIVLPLIFISSCGKYPSESQVRVRVLASQTSSNLSFNVVAEGSSGMSLNGAYVSIKTPENTLLPLTWSNNAQAYTYSTSGASLSGTYRVRVDSQIGGVKEIEVPIIALRGNPEIIDITDGLGKSTKNYEKLQASTPILISWSEVDGASKYLLSLSQNGSLIKTYTSTSNTLIIPENTLTVNTNLSQSLSISIIASSQVGDPFYQTNSYLSTSTRSSSVTSFQVIQ